MYIRKSHCFRASPCPCRSDACRIQWQRTVAAFDSSTYESTPSPLTLSFSLSSRLPLPHSLWLATHRGSRRSKRKRHALPPFQPFCAFIACGPCNWLEPVAHQLFGCGLCDFYDELSALSLSLCLVLMIALPEAMLSGYILAAFSQP